MNPDTGKALNTFRDAFCARFHCAPHQFEKAVLRRCFPAWSRPLGALVLALKPQSFRRELAMLGRLGGGPGERGLRGELDGYVYENQRDKPVRVRTFGLRISRRRFLRLYQAVMGPPQAGPTGADAPTPR